MAQMMPRACPRCGTPLVVNQSVCATCGLNLAPSLSGLAAQPADFGQQGAQVSQHPFSPQAGRASLHSFAPSGPVAQHPYASQSTQVSPQVSQHSLAPQPGPQTSLHAFASQPAQVSQHSFPAQADDQPTAPQPTQVSQHPLVPQSGPQISQHPFAPQLAQVAQHPFAPQISQHPGELPQQRSLAPEAFPQAGDAARFQAPERAAAPQKRRSKKLLWLLLIPVLLLVLGGGGYGLYAYTGRSAPPPTQTPITTTTLNTPPITYAGVDITVLDVQHSQRFLNDPNATNVNPATDAMMRLHLQEQNKLTVPVNVIYSDVARLVLPDGKEVAPTYVKANPGLAPGATQTALVDFVVPAADKVEQLVLRVGGTNEATMDVPLMTNADVSKYAPRTVNVSGSAQYEGLKWSVVSATSQYNIDSKQAGSGMRFLTLTLKVDNTLKQAMIAGSPFDYLRLKAGNTTTAPQFTTLPLTFAQGDTGKTGTVTFQAPQNATSFTLLFQGANGFDPATLNFHV